MLAGEFGLKIERRMLAAFVAGLATVMTVALVMWMSFDTNSASAQVLDCTTAPTFSVASESDLNVAIDCYNDALPGDAGPFSITLTAPITTTATVAIPSPGSGNAAFEPITQSGAGFSLLIDGGGNVLTADTGATLADGLAVVADPAAPVTVTNIVITDAPRHGINVHIGTVAVTNATITNSGRDGIRVRNASTSVTNSTISNNTAASIVFDGGSISFTDSTISGNTDGLVAANGAIIVTNSTVADNTNAGLSLGVGSIDVTSSTVSGNSTITGPNFTSSIVNATTCSSVGDLGNNVGDCFAASTTTTLTALDDNGCVTTHATATGPACVQTMAVPGGSNALGAGTCTVAADQRGQARTPVGAGCEAGAFEASSSTLTIDMTVLGATPGATWDFTITSSAGCFVSNPTATTLSPSVAAAGGSATVDVFDGCSVTLSPATQAGYTTAPAADETFTINGDASRSFTATQTPAVVNTVITKTVVGNASIMSTFNVTVPTGCSSDLSTFTITGSGTQTLALADVAVTTAAECSYTITETAVAGYDTTPSLSQSVTAGGAITFTNTQAPVNVASTVKKVVVGDDSITSSFTITPATGCTATPSTFSITGSGEQLVQLADIATVTATACTYTIVEAPVANYATTPSASQNASPGDTITFTNTQTPVQVASIVEKTVVGDSVTSSFTVTPATGCAANPTSFNITGSGQQSVLVTDITTSTTPCTYTVAESPVSGYTVSPAASQALAPGGTTSFTNTQDPVMVSTTVQKTVVGDQNITSSFTVTVPTGCAANPSSFTIDGTAQQTIELADITTTTAVDCTYTIAEAAIAGYTVSPSASQSATPGATVTFTNTQDPSMVNSTVKKVVVGDDSITSSFTITVPTGCAASPTMFTIDGSGEQTVSLADIATTTAVDCTYTIVEAAVTGYTTSPSASQSATAGSTTTFTNIEEPSADELIISKTVVGDDGITSSFTITPTTGCVANPTTVDISGTDAATIAVTDIAVGNATPCSYTVTETAVAGYTTTPSASQNASPGTTVSFTNTQNPTAVGTTITKTVVGDANTTASFTITVPAGCSASPSTFTIDGSGNQVVQLADITTVTAATCTYTINEAPLAGYTAAPSLSQSTTAGTGVTFTNTQNPALVTTTIEKVVVGNPSIVSSFTVGVPAGCSADPTTFDITGSGSQALQLADITTTTALPCTYTITETPVAGYTTTPTLSQSLSPGATVTFTNIQEPSNLELAISKTVVGDDAITTSFDISASPGCSANPTTVDIQGTDAAIVAVSDIALVTAVPCAYTVTETAVTGYTATPSLVQVGAAGETLSFVNTQDPTTVETVVNKVVVGDDSITSTFRVTVPTGCEATPETFSVDGSGEQRLAMTDIASGTAVPCIYTITETPIAGYTTTPALNQTAAAGDTITFTNTEDPVFVDSVVQKVVLGDDAITSSFDVTVFSGCSASPTSFSISGSGEQIVRLANIATGTAADCTYTVTETPLAGYTTVPALDQTLLPGGTISFTNVEDPSEVEIVISKTVIGDQNITSTFTITPATGCTTALNTVDIAGTGAATITVSDIASDTATACTYTVTETVPSGYHVSPSAEQIAAAGDVVAFRNTQLPTTIESTITKVVVGADDIVSTFTIAAPAGCAANPTTFSIEGSGSQVVQLTDVATDSAAACTYTVSEAPIDGYTATPGLSQPAVAGQTIVFTNTEDATPFGPVLRSAPGADALADDETLLAAIVAQRDGTAPAGDAGPGGGGAVAVASPPLALTGTTAATTLSIGFMFAAAGFFCLGYGRRRSDRNKRR